MKSTAKVNAAATIVHAVALPVALETIAAQVAGALHETTSLSETLGTLTRDAGKLIKKQPEMLDPFVDACRQLCGSVGLTEGSFKVYLSNIRGVIRAMVAGYMPKDGQSLRAMYDAAPKGMGANKGNAGPRHGVKPGAEASDDGDDAETSPVAAKAAAKASADPKRDAIVTLFGHCDDELVAAMAWAAQNEQALIRYVKASVAAAQRAADEAKSDKVPALRKAA